VKKLLKPFHPRYVARFVLPLLAVAVCTTGIPQTARFTSVGPDDMWISPGDISSDGRSIVGVAKQPEQFGSFDRDAAFHLRNGTLSFLLPRLHELTLYYSRATGISANGSVVALTDLKGYFDYDDHIGGYTWINAASPFRWTSDGFQQLEIAGSPSYLNGTERMSKDGGVIVGMTDFTAARWTATGLELLGALSDSGYSKAYDASTDGSVVVGESTATEFDNVHAFRWTAAGGMIDIHLGEGKSVAKAVSGDGRVVVGYVHYIGCGIYWTDWNDEDYMLPFLWTQQSGMMRVAVPAGSTWGQFTGVSTDGNLVVGHCGRPQWQFPPENAAMVWTPLTGAQYLTEFLVTYYDLAEQIAGWQLWDAVQVTPEGRFIVGRGRNPAGNNQMFVVELDLRIVSQPVDTSVVVGETARFTVAAMGPGPIAYQWRKGNAILPGKTSATLEISNVQPGDAGLYRATVSNGAVTLTSDPAKLSVLSAKRK
jgi:probable HAF family extracellular repeat protein